MRLLSMLLFVALLSGAAAAAPPLSNKEIALMLRSGYSSESVLTEVTGRHVLEALDSATRKSLLGFGASAELIAVLESGRYAVSSSEAGQARQRAVEIAARRAAQVEQERKLNARYEAQRAELRANSAVPEPGRTLLLDSLKQKLVRCHDGTVGRTAGADLEGKKFVALYYSAAWCAPCRKFTPDLVAYYNRVASAHPEFEIIFVSSDRTRFAWENYIQEAKMPWLAIDYDQLADLEVVKQLGGGSLPSLLVLDSGSHLVASSYEGEKYLGPQNALAALDKIFGE